MFQIVYTKVLSISEDPPFLVVYFEIVLFVRNIMIHLENNKPNSF